MTTTMKIKSVYNGITKALETTALVFFYFLVMAFLMSVYVRTGLGLLGLEGGFPFWGAVGMVLTIALAEYLKRRLRRHP